MRHHCQVGRRRYTRRFATCGTLRFRHSTQPSRPHRALRRQRSGSVEHLKLCGGPSPPTTRPSASSNHSTQSHERGPGLYPEITSTKNALRCGHTRHRARASLLSAAAGSLDLPHAATAGVTCRYASSTRSSRSTPTTPRRPAESAVTRRSLDLTPLWRQRLCSHRPARGQRAAAVEFRELRRRSRSRGLAVRLDNRQWTSTRSVIRKAEAAQRYASILVD